MSFRSQKNYVMMSINVYVNQKHVQNAQGIHIVKVVSIQHVLDVKAQAHIHF